MSSMNKCYGIKSILIKKIHSSRYEGAIFWFPVVFIKQKDKKAKAKEAKCIKEKYRKKKFKKKL